MDLKVFLLMFRIIEYLKKEFMEWIINSES